MFPRTALAATLFLSPAVSAKVISGSPYLAVHGKAKIEVVPDIFPLEITLKETSKELAATQVGKRVEMLHSFVKKSDRTPKAARTIALARLKEVKDANP